MRAVVVREFGPLGTTKVEEAETPAPGAGEVGIEVHYVPANYVDTLVLEGKYQFLPERPFIPGKGPVGTVASVGIDVTRFVPGDRVLAMAETGGYAECVCVDQEQCYRLPDNMSFEEAASISLAFDTAWFALMERARLRPGETVLVLGATGAVGNAAIQLAKAKGAKVIGAASTPSKARFVREAGADHTIDVAADNLKEAVREQVYAVNGGQGVDVVIDPLGDRYFEAAIRALAWRGRLVVIGFAGGRIPKIAANYLLVKNIEVSGLQVSDYRKRMPGRMRDCFDDIFYLYKRGKIRPGPTTIYSLEEYATALNDLLARKAEGRVLLEP